MNSVDTKFPDIFKKVVKEGKVARSVIDSYNSFLNYDLPNIIKSSIIELSTDGSKIAKFIGDPHFTKPTEYPNTLRANNGNYVAQLSYNIGIFKREKITKGGRQVIRETKISGTSSPVEICNIPIMIGSELDILNDLTDEEKYKHGENPDDPGGYFVMGGVEKILLMQEKIKERYPILYSSSKQKKGVNNIEITYTSGENGTNLNSSVFSLYATDVPILMCRFSKLKSNKDDEVSINVLYLFYVLLDNMIHHSSTNRKILGDIDTFSEYVIKAIQRFMVDTNEESLTIRRNKVRDIIKSTASEISSGSEITSLQNVYKFLRNTLAINASDNIISNIIIGDIFKNANFMRSENQIRAKMRTLSYICSKYIDTISEFREIESRDDWALKRITTAGDLMKTAFASIWHGTMKDIKEKSVIGDWSLDIIVSKLQTSRRGMDGEFISNFKRTSWSIRQRLTTKTYTIVDQISRHNLSDNYSSLSRIRIPGGVKGGGIQKRLVQQSQYGYICPVTTPENENCGLVKDHTICSRITSERDPNIIFNKLLDLPELFQVTVSNESKEEDYAHVFINGICVGITFGEYGQVLKNYLVSARRKQEIPYDTCIYLTNYGELFIYVDGGRIIRPLMIVNKEKEQHEITLQRAWNCSYEEMLSKGIIEYLDSMESREYYIMYKPEELYKFTGNINKSKKLIKSFKPELIKENVVSTIKTVSLENVKPRDRDEIIKLKNYFLTYINDSIPEYTEIDSGAILGVVPNTDIIFLGHSTGPRISYHANMSKQALSLDNINMSPESKKVPRNIMQLDQGDVPLVYTGISKALGIDKYPTGRMVLCAFMVYDSLNMEDAIVINAKSIERGLFHTSHYFGYLSELTTTSGMTQYFGVPPNLDESKKKLFAHIIRDGPLAGLPYKGTIIEEGYPIIAKFTEQKNKHFIDESVYVKLGERGMVDYAEIVKSALTSVQVAKVRLLDKRVPEPGDKFVTSPSQKGILGSIVEDELIPHVVSDDPFMNGVKPSVIFNPHGLITRMTVGKMYEAAAGLVGLKKGRRVVSDPLTVFDGTKLKKALVESGFNSGGTFKMFNPVTNKVMEQEIFIGPVYYHVLKHFVYKVVRARGNGPTDIISRQPRKGNSIVNGKTIAGPYRLGYLPINVFIAYGMAATLKEKTVLTSDLFKACVCECGNICIVNGEQGIVRCPIHGFTKNIYRIDLPYSWVQINHMFDGLGVRFRNMPTLTREI